jgi:Ni,Fe-hydrogenase I cytochrome b subunit
MFDSLADRIREDEHKEVNQTERIIRWVVVAVLSILVFGGLYMGIRMLE